jgi:hypothetical protein
MKSQGNISLTEWNYRLSELERNVEIYEAREAKKTGEGENNKLKQTICSQINELNKAEGATLELYNARKAKAKSLRMLRTMPFFSSSIFHRFNPARIGHKIDREILKNDQKRLNKRLQKLAIRFYDINRPDPSKLLGRVAYLHEVVSDGHFNYGDIEEGTPAYPEVYEETRATNVIQMRVWPKQEQTESVKFDNIAAKLRQAGITFEDPRITKLKAEAESVGFVLK